MFLAGLIRLTDVRQGITGGAVALRQDLGGISQLIDDAVAVNPVPARSDLATILDHDRTGMASRASGDQLLRVVRLGCRRPTTLPQTGILPDLPVNAIMLSQVLLCAIPRFHHVANGYTIFPGSDAAAGIDLDPPRTCPVAAVRALITLVDLCQAPSAFSTSIGKNRRNLYQGCRLVGLVPLLEVLIHMGGKLDVVVYANSVFLCADLSAVVDQPSAQVEAAAASGNLPRVILLIGPLREETVAIGRLIQSQRPPLLPRNVALIGGQRRLFNKSEKTFRDSTRTTRRDPATVVDFDATDAAPVAAIKALLDPIGLPQKLSPLGSILVRWRSGRHLRSPVSLPRTLIRARGKVDIAAGFEPL